ncbi:hypothetical protein [Billgrantia endophytica]|uniref:hypothetical protein n=1 Tax=Billgrantia endophytica TaxID=2033802 RepID=UPI0013FDD792|nr:hypothetical protein [Halomonas endophytica]
MVGHAVVSRPSAEPGRHLSVRQNLPFGLMGRHGMLASHALTANWQASQEKNTEKSRRFPVRQNRNSTLKKHNNANVKATIQSIFVIPSEGVYELLR